MPNSRQTHPLKTTKFFGTGSSQAEEDKPATTGSPRQTGAQILSDIFSELSADGFFYNSICNIADAVFFVRD